MRLFATAAVVLIGACAAMTYVSLRVIPAWATRLMEQGAELSLPAQLAIASGNFWARYFVFIWMLVAVALVVAWRVGARSRERPAE